jgi:hypothetical protein
MGLNKTEMGVYLRAHVSPLDTGFEQLMRDVELEGLTCLGTCIEANCCCDGDQSYGSLVGMSTLQSAGTNKFQ